MAGNQEIVEAYRGVRERMTGLLRGAGDETAALPVPACPEWTVQALVSHVVGVTDDVAAGRLDGAGSDPWTAAQVDARRERSLEELLAEWEAGADAFEAALAAIDPMRAAQSVFDAATHEHDLRGALGSTDARDTDAVEVGWGWATNVLGQLLDGYGDGVLELRTEHGVTIAGTGQPTATVHADRFELFRAMTGRRSAEQVASWEWSGASEGPAARVHLLPARTTSLEE